MTTDTILTNDLIESIIEDIAWPNDEVMQFAKELSRAIEQAVLQSEQVRTWKRDAERLDAMAQKRMLVSPEYEGGWHAEIYDESEAPIAVGFGECPRTAVDSAMEQQK